ncbi:MAG: CoB--CoM heterodisulfide reductase iron-sulfur subunit A family protein [Chloroflexi bacterium]|nr:CoB--CoM heterodisulfide reductase iron-sulfur subunit A family protein [Chloroflexota bacterium]
MNEKVGVYICHCGTNIAGVVDVEETARWASEQPHVAIARDYKFMCSSLGQDLVAADIKEFGLTRIVVAACSPHMHEKTFRGACERAGLNPFLCEMANIRELNAWATKNKPYATQKAKAQIKGAVERVIHHQPLEPLPVTINPNTLVLGGGIAGITAALELANGGHHVYLVEREPSIGGHMAQWDKTFPTLDCAACILTPRMVEVGQHANITLLTNSEVEGVEGYLGNFQVTVRKKARYVNETLCTGCAVCEEKCPKKVVDDVFEAGLTTRKAIYRPFPQAVPKYPVIDRVNCTYFKNGKCKACQILCPPGAIDFEQQDEMLHVEVGNVILTTGYQTFDPQRIPQYGYGRLPNVFTSVEFERMVNAAGPTAGRILLRDRSAEPKSVAIIHCVGSRDENFNEYCSRVCCMYSLKFAHLVRERLPSAEVYNFYIDVRAAGKRYEEFYHRVMKEGANFVRGRVSEVTDVARTLEEEDRLIVQVYDTLMAAQRRIPVDMVILSVGMEARHDAREVGTLFGLGCDFNNFYIERHPKLDPVLTMVEGVFIAGACQGPMAIPETVAQASAAAARAISLIGQRVVMMEPIKAHITAEMCSGCRICNDLCPYEAIQFHADQGVSEVLTALCQGCGTCVAACPSAAISGAHFTRQQLMSQIEGLLWDVRQPELA